MTARSEEGLMARFWRLSGGAALALILAACDARSGATASVDAPTVPTTDEKTAPVATLPVPPADAGIQSARRRPAQSQAESRLQAFYAIWGRVPPVTLDTPTGQAIFRDGEVSYFGGGRAMLVAYGDAATDTGRGAIALRYLTEGENGLQAGPGQLLVIEGDLGPRGQADWAIRRDLMSDPVMIIENNGPWADYSCVGANLVALTAAGPVLLQPGDRRVRPLPNPDNLPLC